MRKLVMFSLLVAFCACIQAASWPYSGPARQVVTLIITPNNKSPRLLAELIQNQSKQPYLLIPAPQSSDTRMFFIPAKGVAHQISEPKMAAFVRFLNPGRIVVLGNETFVPKTYLDKLDPNVPVFVVSCADWVRVSEELTYMLNISGLSRDYKRLRDQMLNESRVYRLSSRPAAQAEPAVEKATEPQVQAGDDQKQPPAQTPAEKTVEEPAGAVDEQPAI